MVWVERRAVGERGVGCGDVFAAVSELYLFLQAWKSRELGLDQRCLLTWRLMGGGRLLLGRAIGGVG
jgi:hypothetical protein